MIIIAGSSNIALAKSLADQLQAEIVIVDNKKFSDNELKIRLNANLRNQDVLIVQSTSYPVNDHLIELLLIIDVAKRNDSSSITVIIPYFGYSRQDKAYNGGEPISLYVVAKMIEAMGIDRIITLDLHSKQSEDFFTQPIYSISTAAHIVAYFQDIPNAIIVSPDTGGITRAKIVADILNADVVIINKVRKNNVCQITNIAGDVRNKNCIIIDDIIDTGYTIEKAVKLLQQNGAKTISTYITHAVLSHECIKILKNLRFLHFYTTDSIYHKNLPEFINVIPVANIIAKLLRDQI